MINIIDEFKKSKMLLDKTTQSLTALPYDLNSVYLKTNQYVTNENFNKALEKLQYNFLYLYRGCNIANFELFDSYFYSVSTSKNLPYYVRSIQQDYNNTTINYSVLSSSHVAAILHSNTPGLLRNYIFFANQKTITGLLLNEGEVKYAYSTDNIDPISGTIKFKNIVDLKTDFSENLYVIDSDYNNLYQYNIINYINFENIYNERLFLKKVIGGFGGANERNKFNKPSRLAVNKNFVVVQDAKNLCFKVYDKNLNWVATNSFVKSFSGVESFDAMILDGNNNLYVGKNTEIRKFRYIKEGVLEFENKFNIDKYFLPDEYIKSFSISNSDDNILYILTNRSVKKVWLSVLDYVIGEFTTNSLSGLDFRWLCVGPYDSEKDIICLYSNNETLENFSINLDTTSFNTLFSIDDGFEVYSLDDVKIKYDEYVQSWIIIKNLEKIYYNTLILLQNIKYKFVEKKFFKYPKIEKKVYNKVFLGYSDTLAFDDNFDIGLNEIFQVEVINRCIKQIYDLQLLLLIYIINNDPGVVFNSPDPTKGSPTVRNYLYFVDESLFMVPSPARLDIFEDFIPGDGILRSLGGAPYSGTESISIEEGTVV